MPDVDRRWLTTGQVAAQFSVSPAMVLSWARDGVLPCVRTLGGRHRYTAAEVERMTLGHIARKYAELHAAEVAARSAQP